MRLPDHFDLIAQHYDRLLPAPDPQALLNLLQVAPGGNVLDVGGGTGRVAQALIAAGIRATICDRSKGMLGEARCKDLRGVLGSVDHLPFADNSLDGLLVVDAFHHFNRPSPEVAQLRAAGELLRILKPGARLVIEEPDIRRLHVRLVALGETLLLMHSRFLPPAHLADLFEAQGGGLLTIEETAFSARLVFVRRGSRQGRTDNSFT